MSVKRRLWNSCYGNMPRPSHCHGGYIAFITGYLLTKSGMTSCRKISWGLEAAKFDVLMIVSLWNLASTVYPKKYAHDFVVLCFVVVMQPFIMNSHEVFIHIHQGCFAGTGAIVRLPQCQWSKPDGYGKISQYITKTKYSKAKTVCIFLGIYCISAALLNTAREW